MNIYKKYAKRMYGIISASSHTDQNNIFVTISWNNAVLDECSTGEGSRDDCKRIYKNH